MKPKSSFFTDEGGSVALMLVVMMFVVVGLLAFVIDLAHIKTVKTELSNAGDACALRGARAFYADARPFKEPADDVRAIAEAKIAIGDNYSDKGLVDTPLQNINDDDIEVGVWNFETRQWLYVAGEQPVFTWPPNAEDYGKVIGPGIGLKIRREEGVNHGPVMMTMARIFQIGSVNVNAPAIAALSPVGSVDADDWRNPDLGIPPPLRLGDEEASDPTLRTFTLYPNNTQAGGWHSYDIKNPNVPVLENLIWGKNQKTGEPIDIPTLTANESVINLQNGVDAKLFQVPDPNKPHDPNQLSLLSRWLYETGREVIDPKVPTYTEPTKTWEVLLPVTSSDQWTGAPTVLGFARVEIEWVNPPPDKTVIIKILEPYVAPPGVKGGGRYFGSMALEPVLVK